MSTRMASQAGERKARRGTRAHTGDRRRRADAAGAAGPELSSPVSPDRRARPSVGRTPVARELRPSSLPALASPLASSSSRGSSQSAETQADRIADRAAERRADTTPVPPSALSARGAHPGSGAGALDSHPALVGAPGAADRRPTSSCGPGAEQIVASLGSPGASLEATDRQSLELLLGRDLSSVRVHHDDVANRLVAAAGALAFTVGSDIVFAAGAFDPRSVRGRHLLAHELVHVGQQQETGQLALQRQTPPGQGGQHPPSRISTSAFWGAYQQIGYNKWHGEDHVDEVWRFVGGNVGKSFAGQNTCATRVSYALNYGGAPIAHYDSTTSFHNDPHVTYDGKAGDGKNYIVGAPSMQTYLASQWGPPDARLSTGVEARTFADSLAADHGAIFAGAHHSGFIMSGYSDPYVFTDPGVLPVHAWKLP